MLLFNVYKPYENVLVYKPYEKRGFFKTKFRELCAYTRQCLRLKPKSDPKSNQSHAIYVQAYDAAAKKASCINSWGDEKLVEIDCKDILGLYCLSCSAHRVQDSP